MGKRILATALLVLVALSAALAGPRPNEVTRVIDGDTIDVHNQGRVRLKGVDTPERGERGFDAAKNFVRRAALGRTVRLVVDSNRPRDRFGRLRATVWVGNMNLNQELLARGYGRAPR